MEVCIVFSHAWVESWRFSSILALNMDLLLQLKFWYQSFIYLLISLTVLIIIGDVIVLQSITTLSRERQSDVLSCPCDLVGLM